MPRRQSAYTEFLLPQSLFETLGTQTEFFGHCERYQVTKKYKNSRLHESFPKAIRRNFLEEFGELEMCCTIDQMHHRFSLDLHDIHKDFSAEEFPSKFFWSLRVFFFNLANCISIVSPFWSTSDLKSVPQVDIEHLELSSQSDCILPWLLLKSFARFLTATMHDQIVLCTA